jgi:small subunit ribosomal protein S3
MTRSVKKGPFIANHLLRKIERANKKGEKISVKTWSRGSIVIPIIIGHTMSVYNGRDHVSVYITDQIVGHKLGEFSPTRNFRGHTKSAKKTGRLYFFILNMGQKTHPIGIRLGITKKSCSCWYSTSKNYAFFLREDEYLRNYILQSFHHCIVSAINLELRGNGIRLRISLAQVRFFVGSDGKELDKLCRALKQKCWNFRSNYFRHFSSSNIKIQKDTRPEIQIFVRQLSCPEADAQFLSNFIVLELEKRLPFRRVVRIAQERAQNLGKVAGVRIQVSGRLNGAEIARTEWVRTGRVPLHTFSIDLDYSRKTARTIYGLLGIKVWIFRSNNSLCFIV